MRRLRQIMRDTSGLTVAEVIVAVGIIMIGLVALLAVAPLTTSQVGQSKLKTTAVFLAQQRLERVKNVAWSCSPTVPPVYVDSLGRSNPATDAPTGTTGTCPPFAVTGTTGVVTFPDEGYNSITFVNSGGAVVATYPQYRRTVRITDCSVAPGCGMPLDPSLAGLRQVTVTVFFRPMTGVGMVGAAEDSVQLTTLLALRQ